MDHPWLKKLDVATVNLERVISGISHIQKKCVDCFEQ